ncbi:MAG: aldo/keto reductase, partial [Bacteroidota bacterium]|nr:aldo/keto reductase [Bacteroidota bacterium]
DACKRAVEFCSESDYPIEKLAMQYSTSEPRIATTIFSTTRPENLKQNIDYANAPIDWEMVKKVKEIIGDQQRVSWSNT